MKKIISAFLVLMMLSGLFVFPAFASDALEITSGNLSDGDTNVGICPVIVYTFSQAIDEASLENITLKTGDGSKTVAIRQKALSADGTTLTMRLGEELLYDSGYVLDISKVAASADATATYGKTVSFTTKYGDNSTDDKYVWIKEDNFETGVYNTTKWRASVASTVTLATKAKDGDEGNTAYMFNSKQAQFQNYTAQIFEFAKKGKFEFDLCVDAMPSGSGALCTIADNFNATTTLLTVEKGSGSGKMTIPNYIDGRTTSSPITVCTWEPNVWMHFEFVVDVDNEVYTATVTKNGETATYNCALAKNSFMGNKIQGFYNQVYVGYKPEIYLDNISICDYDNMNPDLDTLGLVSSSVENGAKGVSVAPEFVFTFDRAINAEDYAPAIYGEPSIGVTATVSGENNNVLTVKLNSDLDFNKEYTLNLSSVKATDGSVQSDDFTFTTEFGYNKTIESFDGDVDYSAGQLDSTTKWRLTNTSALVLEDDALHLVAFDESGNAVNGNLENQARPKGGANLVSNQVVQFDFKFDKTNTSSVTNIGFTVFYEKNDGTHEEIGGILGVTKNKDGETYTLKGVDGKAGNYVPVGTKKIGEWAQIAVIFEPTSSTFRVALDGELADYTYKLPKTVETETLKFIRLGSSRWVFSDYWIDNLKLAQHLALLANENGEYETYFDADGNAIETLDPEKVVYKANIVNNAPVAEEMTLYLALYEEESNELAEVKTYNFTVEPNSVYNLEAGYDDLGEKAYTHKMKAIYTDVNGIKPYSTKMIPSAVAIESNPAEFEVKQISAKEIYPAYPGGHYKAVTVRIDDNNPNCNDAIVNAINNAGIKATFYLPGNGFTDAALYEGHEIGNHSYSHPATDIIHSDGMTKKDIERGKTHNETVSGQTVIGYAYPGTTYGATGEEEYTKWLIETGHKYAVFASTNGNESTVPDLSNLYWIDCSYRLTNNKIVDASADYAENTDKELSWFFATTHAGDVYNANDSIKNTNITAFLENLGNRDDIWYTGNGGVIMYLVDSRKVEVPEIVPGAKIVNSTKTTLYYNAYDAEGNLIETVALNPGDTLEIIE